VALAAVDERPGVAAHMVRGQEAFVLVPLEQRSRRLVVRVTKPSQGEPERRVDEDQCDPPPP
jgi:hypothetical protein